MLDQYCDRLANDKRPTLLLFDEFQELARQDHTAPIVAALRTKHGHAADEGSRRALRRDAP